MKTLKKTSKKNYLPGNKYIPLIILFFLFFGSIARSQYISYQGILFNKHEELMEDGNYKMSFSIYRDDSIELWKEAHPSVKIEQGYFHVLLGITNTIDLPFDKQYYLGVTVSDGQELKPLMPFSSVPFSFRSKVTEKIAGYEISATPEANKLLVLDKNGQFPASVFPVKVPEEKGIFKNKADSTVTNSDAPVISIINNGSDRGLMVSGNETKAVYAKNSSQSQAAVEGENTGAGAGVRGTSKQHHGVIGYSDDATNAGVFGNNQEGTGVWGNSIDHHGVLGQTNNSNAIYGETASADKSAIYGENSQGFGIVGRSNANDGVIGWTKNKSKSGVYGYSSVGSGVTGRSENQDGVLAVTKSSNTSHAALWARNEGSGPALAAEGELHISGKLTGNFTSAMVAPFSRPAFDSGWLSRSQGFIPHAKYHQISRVFQHGIGGDPDNYIVEVKFRGSEFGIHNFRYGGDYYSTGKVEGFNSRPPNTERYWNYGCYWNELSDSSIKVTIMTDDDYIQEVRVRIWTIY